MIAVLMICDGCVAEGIPGLTRAGMVKHGWTCDQRDYCQSCSEQRTQAPATVTKSSFRNARN